MLLSKSTIRSSTRFAMVKTHPPKHCKPPTRLQWFKRTLRTSVVRGDMRWQKRTLPSCVSSYMVCGTPHAPSEPLQASFTIFGGQHNFSESLQASYTLYGGQNALSEALQAHYTFCGDQRLLQASSTVCDGHNSPKLCKPLKRFAVFKTYSPCYTLCAYQHALSQTVEASYWFTVVKTESLPTYNTLFGDLNALSEVQLASYSLSGIQNVLSEPLQAIYTVCRLTTVLSQVL